MSEAEVRRIADSIARYEPAPRAFAITDTGNAERLIAHHGLDLRFVEPWSKWLFWDDKRWKVDETGEVQRRVKETVRRIPAEAEYATGSEAAKAIEKWAKSSESAPRRSAMVKLAASEMGPGKDLIPIRPGDLDRNPWLLNVPNGTIDLRTGELRPHRREDLITHLAPVPYDPDARAPRWVQFVNEIMDGREDLVTFLLRFFGYGLTGDVSEEALLFALGGGCNGKTKLHETIRHVLGDDLCAAAPPGLLLVQAGDRHPTELKRLFRKRIVFSSELPKLGTFNEERLKALTGGDTIAARGMREDFFDFAPSHKLVIYGNDAPRVRDASDGFWRRFRVVPFDVSFKGREDRRLSEKLRAEAPGILAWLVRGCMEWQQHGLGDPVAVREATKDYRDTEDVFGRFVEDSDLSGELSAKDLHDRYARWAKDNGERELSQTALGRELNRRGWLRRRRSDGNYWGIPTVPLLEDV